MLTQKRILFGSGGEVARSDLSPSQRDFVYESIRILILIPNRGLIRKREREKEKVLREYQPRLFVLSLL